MEYLCERCLATSIVTDAHIKIVDRVIAKSDGGLLHLVAWAQCRGCAKHLYWDGEKYTEGGSWWDTL